MYDTLINNDGNYEDQAGVEWTSDELAECKDTGNSEATCPQCGYWIPVGTDDVMDCPQCGRDEGLVSPLVQFGMV